MCVHMFVPERTRSSFVLGGTVTTVESFLCPKCGESRTRDDIAEIRDERVRERLEREARAKAGAEHLRENGNGGRSA